MGVAELDRTEPKHLFPLPHLAPPPAPSVGLPQAPHPLLRPDPSVIKEETPGFYSAPGRVRTLLLILHVTQQRTHDSFCLGNEKAGAQRQQITRPKLHSQWWQDWDPARCRRSAQFSAIRRPRGLREKRPRAAGRR